MYVCCMTMNDEYTFFVEERFMYAHFIVVAIYSILFIIFCVIFFRNYAPERIFFMLKMATQYLKRYAFMH